MKAYAQKIALAAMALAPVSAFASETTPIEDLFAAVDLDGVADLITAMGITVVAISLVFLGIRLVKRALRTV